MGTRVRKAARKGGLGAIWSCVVSCASDLCVCVGGGGLQALNSPKTLPLSLPLPLHTTYTHTGEQRRHQVDAAAVPARVSAGIMAAREGRVERVPLLHALAPRLQCRGTRARTHTLSLFLSLSPPPSPPSLSSLSLLFLSLSISLFLFLFSFSLFLSRPKPKTQTPEPEPQTPKPLGAEGGDGRQGHAGPYRPNPRRLLNLCIENAKNLPCKYFVPQGLKEAMGGKDMLCHYMVVNEFFTL